MPTKAETGCAKFRVYLDLPEGNSAVVGAEETGDYSPRFLGYRLQGRATAKGSKYLHLTVPKEAVRSVVTKIKRATAYIRAPAYDAFTNVNAIARGWCNYYRYAHNISVVNNKLSLVIC